MEDLIIENAVITNRNFEGRVEKPYNPNGIKNFSVMIDNETAHILEKDGWNVKFPKTKDPSDPETSGFLNVTVSYSSPRHIPKIIQVTYDTNNKPHKVPLNESTVVNIDSAEIQDINLVIHPREWEMNGKTGVKAYLKTMYFTLVKDPFEDKYGAPSFDDEEDDDDILPFEI